MQKHKKMIYLLGDILPRGMKMLREKEAQTIREELIDYHLYSAIEQKDINDKSAQTVESNNNLAERIVKKDTEAIMKADVIIAEPDNNSVGSSVELGQIEVMNRYHKALAEMISNSKDDRECIEMLRVFLREHPYKEVYCHNGDIRRTDIPETGDRRSWSINQYLYGVVLNLTNGRGLESFEGIIKKLKKNGK